MAIRLLSIDMDGTLLDHHGEISKADKEWIGICRDHGIKVILGSGRTKDELKAYYEELGLDTPLVTLNGGEVWRTTSGLLSRETIERERVPMILDAARQAGADYIVYTSERTVGKKDWNDLYLLEPCIKIVVFHEDEQARSDMRQALELYSDLELASSWWDNFEVNRRGVSKASGVEKVCSEFGWTLDDVAAIGDSMNDYELVRTCGYGIAMGNATDELKKAARFVTTSHTEDGVAHAIRHLLECKQR